MNRRKFLKFTGIGISAIAVTSQNSFLFCTKTPGKKPNIILIMADDMGYECLSCNGSISYNTPNLDKLAQNGIRFTQAHSQPLCTPTRVKIMTGKYNYRNYEAFGYLNPEDNTFGNMLKEAGYTTCLVGKWQLNGISGQKIPGWEDKSRPNQFGFEEYCLWQLTHGKGDGERYANPLIEQNGEEMPRKKDAYGPDIFCNYILDYIKRKKDNPFFIYYPMVLTHDPFVPTPDSPEWKNEELHYKNNPKFFADMVHYTDKIIGKIWKQLQETGIEENTLLIFTGDNGTHRTITSQTDLGPYQGAKGNTIDAGTRVPLVIYWPEMKQKGQVFEGFIDFTDFYATFADIIGVSDFRDGKSLLPLFKKDNYESRDILFMHYEPRWGFGNQFTNRFARTKEYKLYLDGRFYNLSNDILEEKNILLSECSPVELKIREKLQAFLNQHPAWEIPADIK
jgi:arylsulfatase A